MSGGGLAAAARLADIGSFWNPLRSISSASSATSTSNLPIAALMKAF